MAMVASRMSQYLPQAHTGSHFQASNHGSASSPLLGQPSPTNSDFSEGHVGLEDIRSWDERKVGEWLRSIGWQKYDSVFEKNNITGEALLECDHPVLKELGITKIGDRIRICVAIKTLRTKALGNAKKRNRDTLAALDNMGSTPTPRDRKRFSRTEPLPQNIYPGTPHGVNSPPATASTVRPQPWTPVTTPGSRPNANVKDFCITVYGENGVKRTIDVRECNTPDAIMRRILAKFSKQQDNPILWSLYTITPVNGRDKIKALGDVDLLEIVNNNTLPERSRLVLQRRGSPPSPSSREFVLARKIALEQMERAALVNNSRNDKVQDITGHTSEDIRPESQYRPNPRPARGDKLPPFFQERPPSEFISSNLAEYFPDHGHKALERTVRNSIRRSRMMSRQGTTSSRLSIATTRSFGSSISDHSIPPVPTVGNIWLRDQGAQPLTSAAMMDNTSRRSSVRRPGSVLMPTVFSGGKDDHLGPVPENDVSPIAGDNRQSYMSFDSGDLMQEPIVTITDTSEPSAAGFLGTRDSMISTVSTEMDMNSSLIDRFDEDDEEEFDDEEEEDMSDDNLKWMRGKLIGSGTFGNVYHGLNAITGELMAVKQVEMPTSPGEDSRKQSMIDALTREIAFLKEFQHPNIVQYLASNKEDNCFNIFLEYVPGGSVAGMLNNYGPLREPLIRTFVKQILHGLAYLHGKNIIHRDIKGANVLVDNKGLIKISDFGISKKMEADLLTVSNGAHRPSLQGSVFWMAPEVVKQTSYTLKADIWSLGCLIVEMFTGSHPYPDCSQLQAIFKIGTGGSAPTIPAQSTEEGKVFLSQTFELDHNKRPTADELLLSPFLLPLEK